MTKTPLLTSSSSFIFIFIFIFILLLLSQSTTSTESRDRHVIKFRSPGLYPASLTWDPSSQHFLVASLTQSTFHSISDAAVTETLTLTPSTPTLTLPPNPTILGLTYDHRRNRLLAAVNTATSPYLASFSASRTSLTLESLSPLPTQSPSAAAAAGVTTDPHGSAYVTNPAENVVYKVTADGVVSVLSNSTQLTRHQVDPTSQYIHLGLTGVAYVAGKEYILTVQTNTGKMFKVDAVDGAARSVILPSELPSPKDIAVREDGVVFVLCSEGGVGSVWMLKSDDSWGEGVVIDKIALNEKGESGVSVGGGGRVYVVFGNVEEGILGNGERGEFRIEEVRSKGEDQGELVWPFVMIGLGLVYFLFWRFQMGQLVKNLDKKRS